MFGSSKYGKGFGLKTNSYANNNIANGWHMYLQHASIHCHLLCSRVVYRLGNSYQLHYETGLKAIITNLLGVNGLSRLRAELRVQIKGLTIIMDLISNLLRSPWSHLLATSLNVLVSEGISMPCLQDICLNISLPVMVPTSIPTQH